MCRLFNSLDAKLGKRSLWDILFWEQNGFNKWTFKTLWWSLIIRASLLSSLHNQLLWLLLLFKTIIVTFQHYGGIYPPLYLKRDYFAASTKLNIEMREFVYDVLCADFLSIIPQGIVYMELSLVLLEEKLWEKQDNRFQILLQ